MLDLDRKNRLIADEMAGQGAVDHAPIHPREIARRALEPSASAVVLVHNHPSGDPTPSRADINLTLEIERALAPLEIKAHDHLVVGAGETVRMKAKELIQPGLSQWRHSGLAAPPFIARVAESGSRPQ